MVERQCGVSLSLHNLTKFKSRERHNVRTKQVSHLKRKKKNKTNKTENNLLV